MAMVAEGESAGWFSRGATAMEDMCAQELDFLLPRDMEAVAADAARIDRMLQNDQRMRLSMRGSRDRASASCSYRRSSRLSGAMGRRSPAAAGLEFTSCRREPDRSLQRGGFRGRGTCPRVHRRDRQMMCSVRARWNGRRCATHLRPPSASASSPAG